MIPVLNLLSDEQYYKEVTFKDTIYIHHTAGGHRPDWTIAGWQNDSLGRVATAFVIGGKSITDGDTSYDGKVYLAFEPKYWGFHLGIKAANNKQLNSKAIAIEICNYGGLTLGSDGRYYNYVNKPIPASDVIDLKVPFRGYRYYHKYTDAQIQAVSELIRSLGHEFNINIRLGLPSLVSAGAAAFEINNSALIGAPGVWTHTNVRQDKSDCSPQPKLINMLKGL